MSVDTYTYYCTLYTLSRYKDWKLFVYCIHLVIYVWAMYFIATLLYSRLEFFLHNVRKTVLWKWYGCTVLCTMSFMYGLVLSRPIISRHMDVYFLLCQISTPLASRPSLGDDAWPQPLGGGFFPCQFRAVYSMPHPTELCCTLLSCAAPYWSVLHPTELCRTLLSYAAPYRAMPRPNWATPHPAEICRTLPYYAASFWAMPHLSEHPTEQGEHAEQVTHIWECPLPERGRIVGPSLCPLVCSLYTCKCRSYLGCELVGLGKYPWAMWACVHQTILGGNMALWAWDMCLEMSHTVWSDTAQWSTIDEWTRGVNQLLSLLSKKLGGHLFDLQKLSQKNQRTAVYHLGIRDRWIFSGGHPEAKHNPWHMSQPVKNTTPAGSEAALF